MGWGMTGVEVVGRHSLISICCFLCERLSKAIQQWAGPFELEPFGLHLVDTRPGSYPQQRTFILLNSSSVCFPTLNPSLSGSLQALQGLGRVEPVWLLPCV